jgi:class 3 adenylate cyclase/tetratricopeptide (TPR) repeat protein
VALQPEPTLIGERKIVTIMFADIQGSLALIAGMDPERVDEVLSQTAGKMRQAVHRYAGTVNRMSGDGIMAIFGAPLAYEHHAEQACRAALAILEDAQSDATDDVGPIRIRVGLHSGEVVVRQLISDMTTYYEAMGQAVSVAARMEQAAEAGHVLISPETRRLAGDVVQVRSLGVQPVKGVLQPMELFDLLAVSAAGQHAHRLQWDAASRFVGREPEVTVLTQALLSALAGNGGAVLVTGEAGSGKSRLVQEFLRRCRHIQPVVVTGYAQSFGERGYQVIIGMLEAWLGIVAADSTASLREKIRLGVASAMRSRAADQRQAAITRALTALCDLTASDPAWLVLDPSERRNRITAAVCALFRHISQEAPLVLVAEDLHWGDADSLHVLAKLAGTARTARMLVVMTSRDESKSIDAAAFGAPSCRLGPLNQLEVRELLRSHLISSEDTPAFEENLIAHTGGNPLFIEECLISLSETGDLRREGSRFRPVHQIDVVGLPTTIRALIAARVDRLAPVEKDILQAAAVIGQRVPRLILESIAMHPPAVLDDALRSLCAAQFLVPDEPQRNVPPDPPPDADLYRYRHALTREAVYRSILLRRRREMHDRVVATIERLHHHRIDEYAEVLAEHAQRAEDWPRAANYLRQSAKKAAARSSNRTAVKFLNEARAAAEHLPDAPEKTALLVDVLLDLRYPLFKLGELTEVSRILAHAADMVHAQDDPRRLSLLHAYQSHISWVRGDSLRALQDARISATAAARIPDRGLVVRARFQEGMVLTARGDYPAGIAALSELLDHITAGFGGGTYPDAAMAANAQSYIARACAEIGDFDQARRHAEAAVKLADVIEDPFSQTFAALGVGFLHLSLGDPQAAVTWLERAREKSIQAEAEFLKPLPTGFLGMAYVMAGQAERATPLLEDAIRQADAIGFRASQPYRLAALARAYLAGGRTGDALRKATEAYERACVQSEVFGQATALCVLAEAARQSGPVTSRDADGYLSLALELARRHGLAPIERLCLRALA